MKALAPDNWVGSRDNAILGQIEISEEELLALGGDIGREEEELGPLEFFVFELEDREIVSLSRHD